jgi:hypothetical protein
MPKIQGLTAAAAIAAALIAGSAGAAVPYGKFMVTNDARRVVECTLLVDGHTRTYLKVHVGKAYFDSFPATRRLQLACIRGTQDVFGPLKVGVAYRFVDAPGNRVSVVTAEAP